MWTHIKLKQSVTICENRGGQQRCCAPEADTDNTNHDASVTLPHRMETNHPRNGSVPLTSGQHKPVTLPLIVEREASSCEMKDVSTASPIPKKPPPPPVPIRQSTLGKIWLFSLKGFLSLLYSFNIDPLETINFLTLFESILPVSSMIQSKGLLEPFHNQILKRALKTSVLTLTLTLGLSSTADNSLDSDKKPEHCFSRFVNFS